MQIKQVSKTSNSSRKKTPPKSSIAGPSVAVSELEDRYSTRAQRDQERQLKEEMRLKLQVQQRLHQEKLAAIVAQLHLQLFQLWQDAWLQRQKAWSDSHKAWTKVMFS